jgi:hypothetical protein
MRIEAGPVELIPFSAPNNVEPNAPFPAEISKNPNVLYHGSSSTYEDEIDSEGLRAGASIFVLEELQEICRLFELLQWSGSTGGSLGVLKPFSIDSDFANAEGKPTYLAESSHRACLFASSDFAGGEVARTVRNCFSELYNYVGSEDLRKKHLLELQRQSAELSKLGADPPPLPSTDMSLVKDALDRLNPVRERAIQAESSHQHGVVYAISFDQQQQKRLGGNISMGLTCFGIIQRDQLIAKTHVPRDYSQNQLNKFEIIHLLSLPNIDLIIPRKRK